MSKKSEIEFLEILDSIWSQKIKILGISLSFAVVSYFYSLTIPNEYASEAKVIVVTDSIGKQLEASSLGIFNPFAAPGASSQSFINEYLKSRDFFRQFSKENNIDLLVLGLLDTEDKSEEELLNLIFNPSVREEFESLLLDIPFLSIHGTFNSMINIKSDKGYLQFTATTPNPIVSKVLLDIVIENLNLFFKTKDDKEANKAIEYISTELNKTNLINLQNQLNNLMAAEIQTLVLANIREDYALQYIDKAFIPLSPSSPDRRIYFYGALLVGLFGSIFYFLVRRYLYMISEEET